MQLASAIMLPVAVWQYLRASAGSMFHETTRSHGKRLHHNTVLWQRKIHVCGMPKPTVVLAYNGHHCLRAVRPA